MVFTLVACDENLQDSTIPEDTYPTILGQWPSGNPGTYSVILGNTLEINMQFAPSMYTSGVWYLNDVAYSTGKTFSFVPPAVGIYRLRLEVSTTYHTTSRSAVINVE